VGAGDRAGASIEARDRVLLVYNGMVGGAGWRELLEQLYSGRIWKVPMNIKTCGASREVCGGGDDGVVAEYLHGNAGCHKVRLFETSLHWNDIVIENSLG